MRTSHHDLVERVLDDALAARRLHLRDQVAHRALFDDGVHRHPLVVAQRRDRRPLQRRQQRQDLRAGPRLRTLSMMPTLALRLDGGLEQQRDVVELRPSSTGRRARVLLAMSCVFDSITVSMIRRRLARSDEPVSVTSTMASASIGGFTSVAPQENSTFTLTPCFLKYAFVARTSSVAMVLPSQSCGVLMSRVFRRRQHPAHLAEALLRVDQVGDRLDHAGARRRRLRARRSSRGRSGRRRARRRRRSAPSPARESACTRSRGRRSTGSTSAC